MTLDELSLRLNAIAPTYEAAAPASEVTCIVWMVTGHTRAYSIQMKPLDLAQVTLVVSAQRGAAALQEAVKALLDEAAIPFEEDKIEYDEKYEVIRMTLKLGVLLSPPGPEPPSPVYLTTTYTAYPRLHADGRPHAIVYAVQLNYNCPVNYNYRPALNRLKEELWKRGATYPVEMETSLTNGQRRLTLEFYWMEDVPDGEMHV